MEIYLEKYSNSKQNPRHQKIKNKNEIRMKIPLKIKLQKN